MTPLLLLTANAIAQQAVIDEPPAAAWCDCARLETAETAEAKAQLVQEFTERRAQCLDDMGVSPLHQRKGQGARMDACYCPCINPDAEPVQGPWGDKRKAGNKNH